MSAHEGQQRPLQFGTGSVKQWAEGGRIPHVELVGVSRQNIAHTQEGLTKGGITLSQMSVKRVKMSFILSPQSLWPAAARRGPGVRDSKDSSHRRDAAGVSGPRLSPETHKHLIIRWTEFQEPVFSHHNVFFYPNMHSTTHACLFFNATDNKDWLLFLEYRSCSPASYCNYLTSRHWDHWWCKQHLNTSIP